MVHLDLWYRWSLHFITEYKEGIHLKVMLIKAGLREIGTLQILGQCSRVQLMRVKCFNLQSSTKPDHNLNLPGKIIVDFSKNQEQDRPWANNDSYLRSWYHISSQFGTHVYYLLLAFRVKHHNMYLYCTDYLSAVFLHKSYDILYNTQNLAFLFKVRLKTLMLTILANFVPLSDT